MSGTTTREITLTVPVTAYDQKVDKVTLRRPTVKDIRECGQPYLMVSGGAKADGDSCYKLLLRVCDPPLPGPALDALDPADFDEMCMTLVGFMKPAPRGVGPNTSQPTA